MQQVSSQAKLRNVKSRARFFTLLCNQFTASKGAVDYIVSMGNKIITGGNEMKKLTIVLVVLILATTAMVLHSAEKEGRRVREIEIRRVIGGNADLMPGELARLFKFADKLELTNPQLLQLRIHYQKQAKLSKENKDCNEQCKKLSDPNLKEEDVKKIAAEQAKLLEAKILAKFQMKQELKKILTPEQLKKLEEMREKKSSKKGMSFFRGKKAGTASMPFHKFDKREIKSGEHRSFKKQKSGEVSITEEIKEIE
jgi:Spy/CpxP family protein refolding chaperone